MKRKLQVVYVAVEVITSSARHCSNDCDWMEGKANEGVSCMLFHTSLEWDKRKRQDGYKRAAACKSEQLKET